ncbi:MAG: UDP-N-acetylmuramoyl-L-alanine--D-glutamate ligase [Psychroflexus sp.]|nr:UDP-N-acetylmuramoyl-L-alanine--D-glutamate ligase [Psychroflexus sp.]
MSSKVNILGGGESGVGAAVLAVKNGLDVCVFDQKQIAEKYKTILESYRISYRESQPDAEIALADLIVKSPGIPGDHKTVRQLAQKGLPVISEVEFASRYTDATVIAITGTNGKTTTTKLIQHILQSAGISVAVAGNVGNSFAYEVATNPQPYYVVEVSSFQLDDIVSFKPHIAVITDISSDHLDRYQYQLENYLQAKFKITKNQTPNDYIIYNDDNQLIKKAINEKEIKAYRIPFSMQHQLKEGVYYADNNINISIAKKKYNMSIANETMQGNHNTKNAMAASAVSELLRIRKETIRESMESFDGVEHRMERVLKIQNVQYINDSKGTNINATFYALESMTTPTVWIAGGVDKGNEYSELLPLVNEKVKAIICIGIDNSPIIDAFSKCTDPIIEADSMEVAVQLAYNLAKPKETVLLSPACASFDRFENFEDRGRQFKEAIRKL